MAEEYEAVAKLRAYFNGLDKRVYRSVMTTAQRDKQFERLVQAVTIDRIAGGSSLAKGKIKFEK